MSSDSEQKPEAEADRNHLPLPLRPLSVTVFCDFRLESRDVVLISYPKCDTKSIEIILWKLLWPTASLPKLDVSTNRYLPAIEVVGPNTVLASHQWPRLIKTHLPRNLVPIQHRAKFIYILRNPWDAVAACYRSAYAGQVDSRNFDHFFQSFVDNEQGYGNFFEHVKSWASQKNIGRENFIALTYENVKAQPRSALYAVAAFFGEQYISMLLQDDDRAATVLKDLQQNSWKTRKPERRRKGERPVLSEKQIRILEQKIEHFLKGTDIEHQWKNMLKERKLRSLEKRPEENWLNEYI